MLFSLWLFGYSNGLLASGGLRYRAKGSRLLNVLRRHVDGCQGGPNEQADRDDWVVDCAAQTEIRTLLDQVIEDLELRG